MKAFAKLNEQQEELGGKRFANPRNAAAGSCACSMRESPHRAHFFSAITCWPAVNALRRHSDELEAISALKFEALEWKRCASIEEVKEFCRELEEKREKLPYEIDGIVIKVNELWLQQDLALHPRPRAGPLRTNTRHARNDDRARGHFPGGRTER